MSSARFSWGASSACSTSPEAASSGRALEVKCGDPHALVEVQPVRGGAIRPNTGVEVKLTAPQPAGLVDHPVHQRARVAAAAVLPTGRQVVAVERVAPSERVEDSTARRAGRLLVLGSECGD